MDKPNDAIGNGFEFDVAAEYGGARLGDARLGRRLCAIGRALYDHPELSLPRAVQDRAQLSAVYRFLSHDEVTLARIVEPHVRQTVRRATAEGRVLVLHDTTELEFTTMREGLGRLASDSRSGFFLHTALAVSADAGHRPLGVLDTYTWMRPPARRSRRSGRRLNGTELARLPDRESLRWKEGVERVEGRLDTHVRAIHVADREADSYALLAWLTDRNDGFVIRVSHDRCLDNEDADRVSEACAVTPVLVEMEVPLSASAVRKLPGSARQHAPREARKAQLSVSVRTVQLRRPQHLHDLDDTVEVQLVHAHEDHPPEGAEPIHWILYTSEPVKTHVQALQVLEHYRARWLIEEFFKALKTGCTVEKLQLESYGALANALGVYIPIAYSMLALRSAARATPDAPASVILTSSQLHVLLLFNKVKLPKTPTVAQAMIAVANLGGYRIHKIPPGWLTLARGMEELGLLERGYLAGKGAPLMEDQ